MTYLFLPKHNGKKELVSTTYRALVIVAEKFVLCVQVVAQPFTPLTTPNQLQPQQFNFIMCHSLFIWE